MTAEASYLYRCLFGRAPSERIVERYADAHGHLQLEGGDEVLGADVAQIVREQLDAEAIEYYLRRRDPQNVLTRKNRTLLYLVEIEAEHYADFAEERGSLLRALPSFALAPLRSWIKLRRGRRQARRHHVL
ncbi:MAG: hypothetical protein CSA62_11820 [Planctomycetota bacterium]|nr:MAG: hypothetical protein CSA62_11820 [Planctomycetota bacterium]